MAQIRLLPLAVEAALGAADGYLEVSDVRNGRADAWGRPPAGKSYLSEYSVWAEAGALGGGIVLGMMRFNPDITDPLVLGGTALLSRRLGVHLGIGQIQSGTTYPATPTPMFRAGNVARLPMGRAAPAQGQYVGRKQLPRILS